MRTAAAPLIPSPVVSRGVRRVGRRAQIDHRVLSATLIHRPSCLVYGPPAAVRRAAQTWRLQAFPDGGGTNGNGSMGGGGGGGGRGGSEDSNSNGSGEGGPEGRLAGNTWLLFVAAAAALGLFKVYQRRKQGQQAKAQAASAARHVPHLWSLRVLCVAAALSHNGSHRREAAPCMCSAACLSLQQAVG